MSASKVLAIVCCLYSGSGLTSTDLVVNEKTGLLEMSRGGGLLLSSKYMFWGKDWDWAGLKTKFKILAPLTYEASGNNQKLAFTLKSNVQQVSDDKISWLFVLDAKDSKKDVIGGGIAFKLDTSYFGKELGNPVLLPKNQGWKWGNSQTAGLEVRFDPALASVHFNRRQKSEIRAFFYKGSIPKGKLQHTMTVTLYGGSEIKPTMIERFGTANTQQWPKDSIDFQSFPVDFSFLNANEKPAGKHGFIRSQGDELIFEDDTKARFWGTNITANTLFKTSKINIKNQARRLSSMGFNLVRLHHHDSPWVNPNIFGSREETVQDTQKLDKESLDKLDWWIKSLKDEGIYVWLDLHVQRYLMENDDIFGFDEIAKNKKGKKKSKRRGSSLKGYNYVNRSIIDAMNQFNSSYVKHINPYTKLAYKDEPAIITMLITNENDITFHYGNKLLPNKQVPKHSQLYMQEAKVFAKQHGLPFKKVKRSWEHGPSKIFLNDLERRFNVEMIKGLRDAGVKVPIATTNTWGANPLSSLPALTTGDIIDVHSYGGQLELEKDPLVTPGMTTWMAAGQVANKPLSITEWNVTPFPAPDRHTSSLLVASKASHQGWDAIMQYAYSQGALNSEGKPSNWHSHNDPAFLAMLPAAALLYRKEHVKEASTTYYLAPGDSLFYEEISPKTSVAIRTASEKGKLVIAMPKTKSLPWLIPSDIPAGSTLIRDYKKSLIEPSASSITSDTGELFRNWDEGIYTIDTPQSQAVMGWVGDKTIQLSDTEFQLTTRNATVAVQSLDDLGINLSENILISLSTVSVPDKDLKKRNKLPFHSEPLQGALFIKAKKGLRLSHITNLGSRSYIPVSYNNGKYTIKLDSLPLTHWLRLGS